MTIKLNLIQYWLYILTATIMCSHTLNGQNAITISPLNNGMALEYNGKIKFSGGKPWLEDMCDTIKNSIAVSDSFIYTFGASTSITAKIVRDTAGIIGIRLSLPKGEKHNGKKVAGFFFDHIPEFKTGVALWRYKPWNSWTKPICINSPGELQDWDVQFFYWKYSDGTYGAAIPLSGNGYRTTLGSENGKFGCKALTCNDHAPTQDIPMMVIGVGANPYTLFYKLYRAGLSMMGKDENMREKKLFPTPLEYIGWCTWNASRMGADLNETHLLEGTATFTNHHFPLGWLLIDDGWFDHDGSRINSFKPNPEKFPNGFKSLTSRLKTAYGLKYVGIWHAYNGYWNGINPNSELGRHFKNELYSWAQNERVDVDSKRISYQFIKPESDSLNAFYDQWHRYMTQEGFSFVKVDNQLVTERMSVDTYPIGLVAEKMHQALYASVFKNFGGAIINCMDMTNEAYYNFGKSAIARCVEDYFPEKDGGIGYNLEKGGAAAHITAALYNSLYFSQMVWPDFDMFESYNTYGTFHAAARAISGGPVYITDSPGKQQFDVLWPLIDSNGRIIRADKPAMLTEDCLFQVQGTKPLKAFSFTGNTGLLAVFNTADADTVMGTVSPSDIAGIDGELFAVYEFFSQGLSIMKHHELKQIRLSRMGCLYYNVMQIQHGVALIGLVNKYNAQKTIVLAQIKEKSIDVKLTEGGTFKAVLPKRPVKVTVNKLPVKDFTYVNGLFTLQIPEEASKSPVIHMNF